MPLTLHRLTAIGLLALLGALATLALTWMIFPRQQWNPADLLPADRTVAYVESAGPTEREPFVALVPALAGAPLENARAATALVTLDDGTIAWILFTTGSGEKIRASHPDALLLIQTGQPLGRDPLFRSMRKTLHASPTWGYFQRTVLRQDRFTGVSAVALGGSHGQWTIILPAPAQSPAQSMPADLGLLHSGSVLSVRIADVPYAITALRPLLTKDRQLALATLIQTWSRDALGSDVSMRHELLPALTGPLSFASFGPGVWIARGETAKTSLPAIITSIHTSFRSTTERSARLQRTFDERFPLDILRTDPLAGEEIASETLGWHLRSVPTDDGARGLASAVRGNRFVLGSDVSLVDTLVRGIDAAMRENGLVAKFDVPRNRLMSEPLSGVVPDELALLIARGTGSMVSFGLEHHGDLAILTIR